MPFNSGMLNDFNSKSFDIMNYIDYDRFKNFKKINIDYTFSDNNSVITQGPVFTASKIIESRKTGAYSNKQEPYNNSSFNKMRVLIEYNKIR